MTKRKCYRMNCNGNNHINTFEIICPDCIEEIKQEARNELMEDMRSIGFLSEWGYEELKKQLNKNDNKK